MSQIRVNNIYDAAGGNSSRLYGVSMRDGGTGWVNRIINGSMVIDQRNNGASVTVTGNNYSVDRFLLQASQTSRYSAQQNAGGVTPPAGFTNYLGITSLSAYSVLSSEIFVIQQQVEGFNIADLGWGTASAQTVTLSFWVRSSLTGTFGGSLSNDAVNRAYPFSYAISAANTWEFKTITIAGPTTGTWQTNNATGIRLYLGLGVGSTFSGTAGAWASSDFRSATGAVSVVGTNGATFYITGVQLEAGSVATPFERRDYGRELAMCQRYTCSLVAALSSLNPIIQPGLTNAEVAYQFPVTMRSAPSVSYGSAANFIVYSYSANASKTCTNVTVNYGSVNKTVVQLSWTGSLGTAGTGCALDITNSDKLLFSSEL